MKKADSGEASLEEDLFLTSPMEIVTHEDIIPSDTENKVRLLQGMTWLLISEGRMLGSGQGHPVTPGSAFLMSSPGLEGTSWSGAATCREAPLEGQVGVGESRRALRGRSSRRLPLTLQDSGGPTSSGKPWPVLPHAVLSLLSLLCVLRASYTSVLIRVRVIVFSCL